MGSFRHFVVAGEFGGKGRLASLKLPLSGAAGWEARR
jgi:hypothetical protein